ncbi:hypothetical protein [Kitasatospora mediocidica]|uniref:hypothetical protein n=1 Tax=Kitasatospora mediocidica TaxID=58352 RepID=UPI00055E52AE|nr:hypothetical protein [Kitasatospora mediocidica]
MLFTIAGTEPWSYYCADANRLEIDAVEARTWWEESPDVIIAALRTNGHGSSAVADALELLPGTERVQVCRLFAEYRFETEAVQSAAAASEEHGFADDGQGADWADGTHHSHVPAPGGSAESAELHSEDGYFRWDEEGARWLPIAETSPAQDTAPGRTGQQGDDDETVETYLAEVWETGSGDDIYAAYEEHGLLHRITVTFD